MNDPFRFENMTDADRLRALELARSQPLRDGIPLDTRLLEKTIFSPEIFNAYPIETRKAFFGNVDAQPIKVSQNAPARVFARISGVGQRGIAHRNHPARR